MKLTAIFGIISMFVLAPLAGAQAYDCKNSLDAADAAIVQAKSAFAGMGSNKGRSRALSYIVDAELLLHRARYKFKTSEHRRQDQVVVIAKATSAEGFAQAATKLAQQ